MTNFECFAVRSVYFTILVLAAISLLLMVSCTDKPTAPVLFIDASYVVTDSFVVSYALPTATYVKIWIKDRYGQKVITLVDEAQTAGYKQEVWYLTDSNGIRVSNGIYIVFLTTSQYGTYFYVQVK